MAKQEVDIGVEGNDGTGDSIRESFRKVNENFTELYAVFGLGGTISFTSLQDTPDELVGNESSVPLVSTDGTGISFYKLVSNAGTNDPTDPDNTISFTFTDPPASDPDSSGTLQIRAINVRLNEDQKPATSSPLSVGGGIAAYGGTFTTITDSNLSGLVSTWNSIHSADQGSITEDNLIAPRYYNDGRYANIAGDTMTGALNVPSGASGTQVPQTQEVITRAGSIANRTMEEDLFLHDHAGDLAGAGSPNGPEDYLAVTKFYVDNSSYSSPTNIFVSTSGNDNQDLTPPGKEGSSLTYAYRSINAAMEKAEDLIRATPFEPGPYVQDITYDGGDSQSTIDTISGYTGASATAIAAGAVVDAQKTSIQDAVIQFINDQITAASSDPESIWYNFTYDQELCKRDVGFILESVKLDLLSNGGNYLSRWAGIRYKANPSALLAIKKQYSQTVAGINKALELLQTELTNAGVSSTVYDSYFDIILNMIDDDSSDDPIQIDGDNYIFEIDNGGFAAVDQGLLANQDLREGKIIVGKTSGAKGLILSYERAYTGTTDRIEVQLLEPVEFEAGEEMEYGNITKSNQITVFVESGIYYEHLPIKLPENVSIKGDEFRRTVVRPVQGPSKSKWATTYFYRDSTIDSLTTATAGYSFTHPLTGQTGFYGYHYLTDPTDVNSLPKNNNEMDVFLCNDGVIVRNITVQRHGGFMMVLDPEGQILTRSPYCQTGSSFSQSKGTQRTFAGGLLADGYAGNMPATVTGVTSATRITITSPAGQGLFIRKPPTPFPIWLAGKRYQVNAISNYDQSTGTADLILDESSNEGNGWTGGTGVDIFLQSGGNRSMLANDFTQINDLGFGALIINNALAELVSMFTYYCHTGYLASNGSQIRSLSGNNSYGKFGLVAAGSDPDEQPTPVTLDADMVFPAKIFQADKSLTFASAITGTIAVGESLVQEISGATGVISYFSTDRKTVYLSQVTGVWNTSDEVFGDDSATKIAVPTTVTDLDLDAAADQQFLYVYDLKGLPLNVSEVEVLHTTGLYYPYGITNAQQADFRVHAYDVGAAQFNTAPGAGSAAEFTVQKLNENAVSAGTAGRYQIIISNGGTGYSESTQFTILGTELGGTSPANDLTIDIVSVDGDGVILDVEPTGTPLIDEFTPVRDGQVWKLNFGITDDNAGAQTADSGLQEVPLHNEKAIIRHKQNFVFNGVETVPTRPSTALLFTDDTDTITYRTIGFSNTITDGYNAEANQAQVTIDANFRYVDLTIDQTAITYVENSADITPAIPGGSANRRLGNLGGSQNDVRIAINRLDAVSQNRLAEKEMIFAWGGKVFRIIDYTEHTYDDGLSAANDFAILTLVDLKDTNITSPDPGEGLTVSLANAQGITLKAGLQATETASITINISTCRATSHDMLDIGTGGFNESNYPDRIFGNPVNAPVDTGDAFDENGTASAAQMQERDKGRVFAAVTDQDGFFRVGRFFEVDQGTGSVTFNAALVLTNIDGIGFKRGVRVNEFSNDDSFTDAKGDAVPTQTAVEGYLDRRLGLDRDGDSIGGGRIGPGYMSLGGVGVETPMEGNMNLGSNRITNLIPDTAVLTDAANISYVNAKVAEYDQLEELLDTDTSNAVGGDLLMFTGTLQNAQAVTVSGDITFAYGGSYSAVSTIGAGVIENANISASAAIEDTKLATISTAGKVANSATTGTTANTADTLVLRSASGAFSAGDITVTGATISTNGLTVEAGGISSENGSGTETFAVTAAGALTIASNFETSGTITHTGNIQGPTNSGSDNGVNIGSPTNTYNTVYASVFEGVATEALYADLAENYLGDADYEPGTVLVFGGSAEVTVCSSKGDTRVAGVVTTNPAHLMNSALEGDYVVGLALQGRVPTKVIGKVQKGDMLVTSAVPGYAIANNSPGVGTVIGKAVGTKDTDDRGIVEVVVGRV